MVPNSCWYILHSSSFLSSRPSPRSFVVLKFRERSGAVGLDEGSHRGERYLVSLVGKAGTGEARGERMAGEKEGDVEMSAVPEGQHQRGESLGQSIRGAAAAVLGAEQMRALEDPSLINSTRGSVLGGSFGSKVHIAGASRSLVSSLRNPEDGSIRENITELHPENGQADYGPARVSNWVSLVGGRARRYHRTESNRTLLCLSVQHVIHHYGRDHGHGNPLPTEHDGGPRLHPWFRRHCCNGGSGLLSGVSAGQGEESVLQPSSFLRGPCLHPQRRGLREVHQGAPLCKLVCIALLLHPGLDLQPHVGVLLFRSHLFLGMGSHRGGISRPVRTGKPRNAGLCGTLCCADAFTLRRSYFSCERFTRCPSWPCCPPWP